MKFEEGDVVIIEDIDRVDGFYEKREDYIGREFRVGSRTSWQSDFSSDKNYVACSGHLVSNNEYCFFLSVKLKFVKGFKLSEDLFKI